MGSGAFLRGTLSLWGGLLWSDTLSIVPNYVFFPTLGPQVFIFPSLSLESYLFLSISHQFQILLVHSCQKGGRLTFVYYLCSLQPSYTYLLVPGIFGHSFGFSTWTIVSSVKKTLLFFPSHGYIFTLRNWERFPLGQSVKDDVWKKYFKQEESDLRLEKKYETQKEKESRENGRNRGKSKRKLHV